MASLLHLRPKESRAPETEVLPDSRKRLTRFFEVASKSEIPAELNFSWGDLDAFPQANLASEWQGLRLTNRKLTDNLEGPGFDSRPILQLIYEQIDESAETQVGEAEIDHLDDGRVSIVLNYLQFTTGIYNPGTVGTTTAPVDSSAYLLKEEAPDDGTLRRITRTFVYAGIIATDEQTKNNGALSIKTITSVKTVPSTPSGYILIGKPVQHPNGLPIYTYTYAKGTGEIRRETTYTQSHDQGATTGVTRIIITHLTDPSVDTNPTSVTDYVLTGLDNQDQDGYRVWTATWATGIGLVSQSIRNRNDGLREVTYVSLNTRIAPSGVVIVDEQEEGSRLHDGVVIYTVTAMQSAEGEDPTSATVSLQRRVPFTYPGRAKAYSKSAGGNTFIDVFLSPPIETELTADVDVSYQTSGDLGSLAHDYWQPTEWATIEAYWVGPYGYPALHIEALRGYRSIDDTAVTATASILDQGTDVACMGKPVFGGTTASIQVFGGPDDPGGDTFTLHADVELAFTSTAGTKYFRLTVISAAVAAQADLPV